MAVPVVPGFAREKKTRPVTARAAPPCSGLRHSRHLRVDLALARREPRWRPCAPTTPPPPAIVLLPPAPQHAELGAPRIPQHPSLGARLPSSSSGLPSLPEPRLLGFHLGLRKPPPRATPARPGPCLSRAPPPAARPPPHVTRPRRGFR
ncbi:WAS/WASL-interacting protein family member 1-like [Peromyscus californicus insignis]|uniref:WAS/WASL-interacting protein family member 1-like n=1 Tax=Peromyscus californicus insignis TaxID=564181 RepID=UPI0022A668A4|nr:WAS/WASL-interacting protein family member 1-like [Peromyscus californicus insignis]